MEWKKVTLGEVCNIRRGASPRPIQEFLSSQGMPWIKISDATATDSKYIDKTKEFIIEEGVSHSVLIEPGTLIVSNSATPGLPKISRITACVHDGWLVIDNFRGILKDFLYYKFIEIRSILGNQANGSVFMNLKTDIVKEFLIHIPDIEKQRKIVSILSSLDDKIENNNRINRNLEAQAQALFKSWFGEETNTVKLNEVSLNVTDGVHNTVIDDKDGEYLLLSCKNIVGGQLTINSNERRINQETFEKLRKRTKLAQGDILISTVGTVGEVVLLFDNPTNIEFQRSVGLVKPDKSKISSAYMYCALRFKQNALKHIAHGAVQQCIFIGDLKDFEIPYSSMEKTMQFDNIVSSIFYQISANIKESQRLAQLRDTLLPKLMKGEIEL